MPENKRKKLHAKGWKIGTAKVSSVCPMRKSHQIQPITSCRLHPLWTIEMHHSVRSACTGFTEAARRAGTMLATSAHTASMTIDPPRTTGSQPFT
jgi:hypothetical protein